MPHHSLPRTDSTHCREIGHQEGSSNHTFSRWDSGCVERRGVCLRQWLQCGVTPATSLQKKKKNVFRLGPPCGATKTKTAKLPGASRRAHRRQFGEFDRTCVHMGSSHHFFDHLFPVTHLFVNFVALMHRVSHIYFSVLNEFWQNGEVAEEEGT